MANSDHTKWGKEFQEQVRAWFINEYGPGFELEKEIELGATPKIKKSHKFDIVNTDLKIAIECKRYTWTETDGVPPGKIRALNETVLYLRLLGDDYTKYIVMLEDYSKKRNKTLAEYYYEKNSHLLGDIKVAEFDPGNPDSFNIISNNCEE